MKKYTLGLFAIGFIMAPLFSFAQVEYPDPSPYQTDCISINNNLRYRDRDIYKSNEVSTLQDFLQSKGYLNNEPTGYFGLLTLSAVKNFQSAYGITPVSGYVGPVSRAKIKEITCDDITPNFSKPVISGTQGPQNLNINETGTWRILATDVSGGDLSYSVNWGDVYVGLNSNSIYPVQMNLPQSSTFTHSYSQVGNYTAVFTVTNNLGRSATASLSVNVVGINSISAITVLSLNGGETLYKGNNQTVTWKDDMSFSCSIGALCAYLIKYYDISISTYCIGNCITIAPMVYNIAQNVLGYNYNWQVGYLSNNSHLSAGTYKINVCRSGTNVCDSSDYPFTIQ